MKRMPDPENKKQILAIIPARGGSKGVPRKNIRLLAGKSLIAWTIETALQTPCLGKVIVSTDDQEIAGVARKYGGDVPFLRPIEFARDDTTDMPVYEHALRWLAEHDDYYPDIIVWLRPTAPLRTVEDIEKAVLLLEETKADWVRSVCEAEHHPYWMYGINGDKLHPLIDGIDIRKYLRRQMLPIAYRINGAVDVTWRKTILEKKLLYSGDMRAYVMPVERSIDVDTYLDFSILETIMKEWK